MQKVSGLAPIIHIQQMAFMGFVDVLKNIFIIKNNFKIVKDSISTFKPDVLILVDYPGFNLRIAKWAFKKKINVNYYISPSVWAWKESRVEQIKKYTNKLFVILPFEEEFYKKHNHKVYFVGHPLIDAINQQKPIIAVLPGSRIQEIERMLSIMIQVASHFTDYQFVFAGSSNLSKKYFSDLEKHNIKVVFNQTYELMSYAQAGIIKSGTSTLESALFKLPQVVCYKTGALSFLIGKRLVNLKFISLVNLIMNKLVVKELIQNDFTVKNISDELFKLLNNQDYRNIMINNYNQLQIKLGGDGASKRIAETIVSDYKTAY